jgi:hypothetical protein
VNVYGAYALTAAAGGLTSLLVALVGINHFSSITDSGMWAIAAMVAAPCLMAVGVAYFISKTFRDAPEVRPFGPITAGDRGRVTESPEGIQRGGPGD